MTKYKIYDTYEGDPELIDVADNDEDLLRILKEYMDECDGECSLVVREYLDEWFDEFHNRYRVVKERDDITCFCICKNSDSILFDTRMSFRYSNRPDRKDCENDFVDYLSKMDLNVGYQRFLSESGRG